MRFRLAPGLFVAVLLSCGTLHAQGIECSRARTTVEKAICASPALLELDRQVATAYGAAVARQPDQREAMRTDLLRWLRQRDAACNVPPTAIERCLSGQLTTRLAALTPAAPSAPTPAAPSTAAVTPAPTATPAAPVPPVSVPDQVIPAATANPPAPVATLEAASVPAASEADTLLRVTSPGRFAIAAHSPSGAALQLVDMLTGPSEVSGLAGSQDGRLDRLLDVGTYKLRVFSAAGATGSVALAVTPFHDAAPSAALPRPGHPLATTLKDGEQRGFWLLVPPGDGPNVRIEAAGRSLADLRLWRDGRELAALDPVRLRVEPASGRPLDDLRLVGRVEPGTYLAVAYGGPAASWTNGAADQPLHLRSGASAALAEGWAGGTVGPFGSEVFTLPTAARLLRLDLPAAAPAELHLGDALATVEKTSREPVARLQRPSGQQEVVEVRAAEGQAYTLRALDMLTGRSLSRPGTWWVSAVTTGLGGDEAPPSLLLRKAEQRDQPLRIVASTAPRIAPGAPWHARFNLRGTTDLIFQLPSGGDAAFSSTGVAVKHQRGAVANLPADYYDLTLEPQAGAVGAIDLVVGQPGPTPAPLVTPLPPDPVLPFGVQTLTPGQSLTLDSGQVPGATVGLAVRPVPVALVEGPLLATVAAGNALSVPVQVAPGGSLVVTELGVGPIAFGQQDAGQPGRTTVVVPLADHPRTVALSWHRTETALPPIPTPPPATDVATVEAGTPSFLDLRRGEERGFALNVPTGGLFRVETLGRLHTAARLATPFIPRLAQGDGNGVGQNMLIQSALRAGRYRVDVRALDSAGHLGLLASPAPLLAGGRLLPGGSVRATLPAGTGVAFPVTIAGAATDRYRFDVLSLGAPWTGRLEDADGWPVVAPGALDGLEAGLRPGAYRLVVTPDSVDRQVVVRLRALTGAAEITGHGPHPLPFAASQHATWREPDGKDRPRDPDTWTFALAGPAEVTLKLGDGMIGELHRKGGTDRVARVVRSWTGTLEPGDYQLDATSLGRNDRLGYSVALDSPHLQPATPRQVTLPASVPFSLGQARVASLASWGTTPVRAVLRTADGTVIARYGARPDDWNIAASRLLPAGSYTLDLQSAAPPDVSATSREGSRPGADSEDAPEDDDQAAQTDATRGAVAKKADRDAPSQDASDTPSSDASNGDAAADTGPKVTLRLDLPPTLAPSPAPAQAAELPGNGVHVLSLPLPPAGSLLLAQAQTAATMVLALERQAGDGWQTVALDTGRAPLVAAPADAAAAAWRLEAWTVDGGNDPIRLAARALTLDGASPGQVALAAVEGLPAPAAVARVRLAQPGIVALGAAPGLLAGGWPGHALQRAGDGAVAMDTALWVVAPQPVGVAVTPRTLPTGTETTILLEPGLVAALPAPASQDGRVQLWRADSGADQPNFGPGGGIARGSAVVLASAPATLRAEGSARLRLRRWDAGLAPSRTVDTVGQFLLPAGSAMPVTLPPGDKTLQCDVGPGVAVFAGWHDANPVAIWGADAAVSRSFTGAWTDILMVNLSTQPAPARLAVTPGAAATPLRPGMAMKRFFGAAGSFDLAFEAPDAAKLVVAGDASLVASTPATIGRGTAVPVAGAGRVVVQHGPGAVALWLDAPGQSPWPEPAAQPVSLPAQVPLAGAAMALSFTADSPMLLHVGTTAPVLAGLQQAGRTDPPALFAAGAELHRMVGAGPVTLLLVSADDGPLAGTVRVWAEKLTPLGEGLGDQVAVAPGGAAAFDFTLAKAATIGVGVRAEPDRLDARLLDMTGKVVGTGVAQLRPLPAGRYVLEALVPADAQPTVLRPALIGITPRGNGPPPDVVQSYLELVGMKPQGTP